MALSKIQAESMNLADTYAFTGTVSGAGKILQSKNVTAGTWANTNNWNTTSTSYVDSGLNLTITPLSSSSTILGTGFISYGADMTYTAPRWDFKIYRNSGTVDVTQGNAGRYHKALGHASQLTRFDVYYSSPIGLVDNSHNTTSEITYELYVSSGGSQNRGGQISLQLFEIAS